MLFQPRQDVHIFCSYLFHNFRTSTGNGSEASLTVVFHAMLSDKFKKEDGTEIVIRGEDPVFYGWNNGGVPIKTGT